jgi:ferredoxin
MNEVIVRALRRLPDNVVGRFFTTESCEGCAYCASIAPDNFDFQKNSNTYFVSRQPRTRAEEEDMLEALDDCPVDAICIDETSGAKAV